jgi:hypothetical protein
LCGDLPDLVFGDERAAGEAPDAAVDDAHAKAGAFFASAAAESPAAGDDAIAHADAVADVPGKPDVGIAAAEPLGFAEHNVRHALEARFEHTRFRRLRQEVADEVAGVEREAGGTESLDEISPFHDVSGGSKDPPLLPEGNRIAIRREI